jgi:hypothetical protein
MGAGAARKVSAVRWGLVRGILAAWLFTIPAAGLVSAGMETLTRRPGGSVVVFGIAVVFSAGIFYVAHTGASGRHGARAQVHPAAPPAA